MHADESLDVENVFAVTPHRWREAWAARRCHHRPTITFDRPTRTLPVSVTGSYCALQCAHCGGRYLRHMRPIDDAAKPGALDGATSLLVSGGCDAAGRVPVLEHLETLRRLGDGRRLNWHLGLIDEATMRAVAPLADVVSFDVVGDADTAREVYGLDVGLDTYLETLRMMRRHARVVPHITVGLRAGRLSGEMAAVSALAAEGVEALVFIVLIPTEGTAFARCAPPAVEDVADVLLEARVRLPQARLTLGCMRPHGAYRQAVDEVAVRAGLNGVVNPTRVAERVAEELGLAITWGNECCGLG